MLVVVDHGNSDMKLPGFKFCSGLIEHHVRPPSDELIEYAGSFWTLSNDRIPYMRKKTADNRFFILTLFAVAKELARTGRLKPINEIDLAVGLPPGHYGDQRVSFGQYFKRDGLMNFVYNGTAMSISVRNVFVYPQAYAAVVPQSARLAQLSRVFVVDIGGMTTDVLLLRNGRPDMQVCRSLEIGIIALQNMLIGQVGSRHDMTIEADHIDSVLQGQATILPEEVQQTIRAAAQQHTILILEKLRDQQVDLRSTPVIFIGGGSILLRSYLTSSPLVTKSDFVLDANANAMGYKLLATEQLKRSSDVL